MKGQFLQNYFPAVKLVCQIMIMANIILQGQTNDAHLSIQVCLIAVILLLSTLYEAEHRWRWLWLLGEGLLIGFTYWYATPGVLFLLPFWMLDVVTWYFLPRRKLPWSAYLFPMLGFLLPHGNGSFYFFCCLFSQVFYLQHYTVLGHYQERMKDYEQEEYALKDTIDRHEIRLKEELRERSLHYENRILEERARLSQELHDKLGHSINGSIYQLEASKVLLDRDREKSMSMIQDVIDSLRSGMEEIRSILRKEKPNKTQMAILQLYGLSEECREKYGIEMELGIQGDSSRITDEVWEVILDNTFEAVTNALKYSRCKHIQVGLHVMNKLVRCSVADDGKGCAKLEPGMGIEGMKQRVRRLNGTMDIETTGGFIVNMLLPNEMSER